MSNVGRFFAWFWPHPSFSMVGLNTRGPSPHDCCLKKKTRDQLVLALIIAYHYNTPLTTCYLANPLGLGKLCTLSNAFWFSWVTRLNLEKQTRPCWSPGIYDTQNHYRPPLHLKEFLKTRTHFNQLCDCVLRFISMAENDPQKYTLGYQRFLFLRLSPPSEVSSVCSFIVHFCSPGEYVFIE